MILRRNLSKKPGIYRFINLINGKPYIGKAKVLQDRIMQHHEPKCNQVIDKAIKKYGWENFEIEILYEQEIFDNLELLALETAFIVFFESLTTQGGYNVCLFGSDSSGTRRSKEAIEKTNKTWKEKRKNGWKMSKESIERSANSRRGHKMTPEQIIRITKGNQDKNIKKVAQIDIQTNKTIKIWKSVIEASRFFTKNKKYTGQISGVCNKRTNNRGYTFKTAFGFKWEFI
jgi:group I intron endonuclease